MAFFKYISDEAFPDDSLKRYVSTFHGGMQWASVLPIIENVELTFIEKAIGTDLYEELSTAYTGNTLTADQAILVKKLQRSIAYFTAFQAGYDLLILLADSGQKEAASADGTAVPVRQWVHKKTLQTNFREGHKFLEMALTWLEANSTKFPTWEGSKAYLKSKELFFNNSEELGAFLPLWNGRLVYLQLRPFISEAEKRYIKPVIGIALWDELKTSIRDNLPDDLTDDQKELLDYIRRALTKWALLCAIPFLRLVINENGLVEIPFDSDLGNRTTSEEVVRSMWVNLQEAGQLFLLELKTYLDTSGKFTTYNDSSSKDDAAVHVGMILPYEDGEGNNPVIAF